MVSGLASERETPKTALSPFRVLLVDADPQYNLTTFVGHEESPTMLADVLLAPDKICEAITRSRAGLADIINGSRETAAVQDELKARHKSPYIALRRILDTVRDDYDFIFIDTARTMDLMSVSALAAADEILVPIDCDPMAVKGLGLIRQSLQELGDAELLRTQPKIRILLTKYPGRKPTPRGVRETVEYVRSLGLSTYETVIRYSEQGREAFPQAQTMLDLFPKSNPAQDYRQLAREFTSTLREGPLTLVACIEKGGTMKTTTIATLGHALTKPIVSEMISESGVLE